MYLVQDPNESDFFYPRKANKKVGTGFCEVATPKQPSKGSVTIPITELSKPSEPQPEPMDEDEVSDEREAEQLAEISGVFIKEVAEPDMACQSIATVSYSVKESEEESS